MSPDPSGLTVRILDGTTELAEANTVLGEVWGTATPILPLELLVAVSHAGGHVAGAFIAGRMVGASAGFLARHRDRPALHSHVTGVLPTHRGTGAGLALKLHQRAWAAERHLDWITWTFDPLVRRNAWFNIALLGADVHGYHERFYGDMDDSINAGDESDRLLVAWDVAGEVPARPRDGSDLDPTATTLVPTPDDVVALRRTDPAMTARWRHETRRALATALAEGRRIVGFTRDGQYVIGSQA